MCGSTLQGKQTTKRLFVIYLVLPYSIRKSCYPDYFYFSYPVGSTLSNEQRCDVVFVKDSLVRSWKVLALLVDSVTGLSLVQEASEDCRHYFWILPHIIWLLQNHILYPLDLIHHFRICNMKLVSVGLFNMNHIHVLVV